MALAGFHNLVVVFRMNIWNTLNTPLIPLTVKSTVINPAVKKKTFVECDIKVWITNTELEITYCMVLFFWHQSHMKHWNVINASLGKKQQLESNLKVDVQQQSVTVTGGGKLIQSNLWKHSQLSETTVFSRRMGTVIVYGPQLFPYTMFT